MITKNISLFFSGNAAFQQRDVKGFKTAIVTVVAPNNCNVTFNPFKTTDGTTASSSSLKCDIYNDNGFVGNSININSAGTYTFYIDITGATNLVINKTYGSESERVTASTTNLTQDKLPVTEQVKDHIVLDAVPSNEDVYAGLNSKNGVIIGTSNQIYVSKGIKQIEFEASGRGKLVVEGSNDDFSTSENLILYNESLHNIINATYLTVTSDKTKIFANVEGYQKVRISNLQDTTIFITNYLEHKEYIEGKEIVLKMTTLVPFWKGYKYFQILFDESEVYNGVENQSEVKDLSCIIKMSNSQGALNLTTMKFYDMGMNPFEANYITKYGLRLLGTPVGGGFIIEIADTVSGMHSVYSQYAHVNQTIQGYVKNPAFRVRGYTSAPDRKMLFGDVYKKMFEHADYDVYSTPCENTNRDVFNSDVVEWTDNTITFYQGGYLGVKYVIPFDAEHFNHFVEGETINFAYLLPFKMDRRTDVVGTTNFPSRIVVFTNSRVFHNFPYRSDIGNNSPTSDGQLFDESIIYKKREGNKLPVNDKAKVDTYHKYFPVLKDYDYEQFDGRVYGTDGFVDVYNNGGLPNNAILQNMPISGVAFWTRIKYSSMTKGPKMCTFGNYNNVPGSEPIVMCTNDGGKTWYIQAYFACTDFYNYMCGGRIDLTPITNVAGGYVTNSLKMCRKRFNVPTESVKEPNTPFIIDANDQVLVSSFSTDADGNTIVNLAAEIDYDGVYPIVYFENISANSEWNYICNTGFTANGNTNNGNFFRVEKISNTQYKLLGDLGNPFTGDKVCRHIHAVNDCAPGVVISTGESYTDGKFEGGFLYLLQQSSKNGSSTISISSQANNVIRLCSSPNGVNRASGAYLFSDDADPTLLYVSDEAFPDNFKRNAAIEGRTIEVPICPTGIFVGKLSKIDDQKKFKCVAEIHVTVVGLVENHGHFAADGHYNSVMFSKDGYKWNIDVFDGSEINGTDNSGNIYFGDKVVMFK